MDSKQRMIASIKFEGPDRLPVAFPVPDDWIEATGAPEPAKTHLRRLAEEYPQDFEDLSYGVAEGWTPAFYADGEWTDEWGVRWRDNTVVHHPLADWSELDEYVFADPHSPGRFDDVAARIEKYGGRSYLLGRHMSTLFERYSFLRGFENGLVDHVLYPDQFRYLKDRIMDFSVGIVEEWLRLGVDGIYFGDDFGMQDRPLMSPETWRELYREDYQRLMDPVREAGKDILFHSDGNIFPLLEDLIEVGVQVINPVQKHALNFETLGKCYRGRLVFWGGIDTQEVLPKWSPERVREEVRWVVKTLSSPDGGYLAKPGHVLLPDMPIENVIAMYEEFVNFRW